MSLDNIKKIKALLMDLEAHIRILGLSEKRQGWSRVAHILSLTDQLRELLFEKNESKQNSLQLPDDQPLWSLAYISKSNVPESHISAQCEQIVDVARARNKTLGITGFLVYRAGYFIQFLEGAQENLDLLYGRIVLDKRHGQLRLLYRGPIKKRNFPSWNMDYSVATLEEDENLKSELIHKLETESQQLNETEVLSILNFIRNYSTRKSLMGSV